MIRQSSLRRLILAVRITPFAHVSNHFRTEKRQHLLSGLFAIDVSAKPKRHVVSRVAKGISTEGEPVAVGNRSTSPLAMAVHVANETSEACGAR